MTVASLFIFNFKKEHNHEKENKMYPSLFFIFHYLDRMWKSFSVSSDR